MVSSKSLYAARIDLYSVISTLVFTFMIFSIIDDIFLVNDFI